MEIKVGLDHAVPLAKEAELRSGYVGPLASPSGRFLALLESPRSLLIVELILEDDHCPRAAIGGVGSESCSLAATAVLPSESDITGFGWMQSCEYDVLADCSASGLRIWEMASSQSPSSSNIKRNVKSSAALHVVSLGGVDGMHMGGGTPPPRDICWHPGGQRVICVTTPKGLHLWTQAQEEHGAWEGLVHHACAFGSSKLCGSITWSVLETEGEGGSGGESDRGASSAHERSVMYVTGEGGVNVFIWEESKEGDTRVHLCGQQLVDASGCSHVARGVVALSRCGLAAVSFDGTLMMRSPPMGPPLLKPLQGSSGTDDGKETGSPPTDVLSTLLAGGLVGGQVGKFKSRGGPLISVISEDVPSGSHEQESQGSEPRRASAGGLLDLERQGAVDFLASSGASKVADTRSLGSASACARLVLFKVGTEQTPGDREAVVVEIVSVREMEGVVVPDVLSVIPGPPSASEESSPVPLADVRNPTDASKAGRPRVCVARDMGHERIVVGASAQSCFSILKVKKAPGAGLGRVQSDEEHTLEKVASVVVMTTSGLDLNPSCTSSPLLLAYDSALGEWCCLCDWDMRNSDDSKELVDAHGTSQGRTDGDSEADSRHVGSLTAGRSAEAAVGGGRASGRPMAGHLRMPLLRGLCALPTIAMERDGDGGGRDALGRCMMLLATKLDAFPAFLGAATTRCRLDLVKVRTFRAESALKQDDARAPPTKALGQELASHFTSLREHMDKRLDALLDVLASHGRRLERLENAVSLNNR